MNFRLSTYYIILGSVLGLLLIACQNTGQNGSSFPKEAMDQLRLAAKTPRYERLPQQTTKIKGEGFVKTKGKSLIYVPKGAIMDSAGKTHEGTFEVKVREALTMNDFVQSGLNTLSDKGILESSGMMQILVQDTAGNALKINPERGLRLSMPINSPAQPVNPFRKVALKKEQDTLRKGWQLFYGSKDENGNMIWKEAEQPKQVVNTDGYMYGKSFEQIERFVKNVELAKSDPVLNKYKTQKELRYKRFYYKDRLYPDIVYNHKRNGSYANIVFDMYLLKLMDQNELPRSKSGLEHEYEYWEIIPSVSCNDNIYAIISGYEIHFRSSRIGAKINTKAKGNSIFNEYHCKDTLPITTSYLHHSYREITNLKDTKETKVDTLWLFNITKSYQRIKKIYYGLKDDKVFRERLKNFEDSVLTVLKENQKKLEKTARIEAVINQTGWYNCDCYTREERFAGTFEVEGCEPELEPYLRLAWVQPDLNISIQPNLKQSPNYEFTGVKKSGGVLIAWIPGLMVGSLAVKPEQVQQGQANNPIPVGKLVLQPADDKKINALIEHLSRPVAMAERQRGD